MNITKENLKAIIKEEVENYVNERLHEDDEIKVGDFLEIEISDDRRSHSIEKIDDPESEYRNTRGPYTSFKALVKIMQVAKPGEDY
jgi:hypothetical protein